MLAILLAALGQPGLQVRPTSLRHMVFAAHIAAAGGISTAYRGAGAGEAGAPSSVGAEGSDAADTTITVDVLDALDDGSLVVTVREADDAPIKVGITKDGGLISITPERSPTVGENMLLRMLARSFVAGHDDSPGEAWTLAFGPDNSGQLNVSVSKVQGPHVLLALKGTFFQTSPETRRQRMDGTVTYDSSHTIPVQANINESISVENGNGTEYTEYQAQFALQADSMGGS